MIKEINILDTYRCFTVMVAMCEPYLRWGLELLVRVGAQRIVDRTIIHMYAEINGNFAITQTFLCRIHNFSGVIQRCLDTFRHMTILG